MNQIVRLKVNGTDHELDIPARRMLVDCIRYDIGLTGTKEGCSVGVCGACAVLVDKPIRIKQDSFRRIATAGNRRLGANIVVLD